MLKWIENLFTGCFKKTEQLRKENNQLKKEVEDLQNKVLEKQEQINKTNAYYKKKMHTMKTNKPTKKGL